MSSTTPPQSTFHSSSRSQRMMLLLSGAVLVIGIATFLGVFLTRGTAHEPAVQSGGSIVSQGPVDKNPIVGGNVSAQKTPASKSALSVARTFLVTAVARKHLDIAYGIVGPWLKGESR